MTQPQKSDVEAINWLDYPGQEPYMGLDLIKTPNIVYIEGGGGRSTKHVLNQVIELGGKSVVIDLCLPANKPVIINGEDWGIHYSAGDYTPKKELYKKIAESPLKNIFECYDMDIMDFWKQMESSKSFRHKILNGKDKIDFYFDDGLHHSKYLIPLFKIIIPLCNKDAIIGSHDTNDVDMSEFRTWLLNHPELEIAKDDTNTLMMRKK